MKREYPITLAFLPAIFLAITIPAGEVLADQPPLTYKDLVREARRYERLEGSERVVSNTVLFHKVRLDLRPFGGGSKDFFVVRKDEIGFVCSRMTPGFKGGTVQATVIRHEEGGEGSQFFVLDSCAAVK